MTNARLQPSPDEPSFAVEETVTPEKAREWLKRNRSNRKVSKYLVRQLVKDIQEGLFKPNGQPIAFDRDGYLHDGQHRLTACVEANQPILTLVAYHVDPDTRITVDSGRRRSIADNLTMRGMSNGSIVGAAARLAMRYEAEGRALDPDSMGRKDRSGTSPRDVMAWVREHPEIEGSASHIARHATKLRLIAPTSALAMTHWIAGQINAAKRDEFFDRLNDGVGLQPGNPIYALRERNRLIKQRRIGVTDTLESLAYLIRAWNAYVCGAPLKAFKPTMEFPQFIDYPLVGDNRGMCPRGTSPDDRIALVVVHGNNQTHTRIDVEKTLANLELTAQELHFVKWPPGSTEWRVKKAAQMQAAWARQRAAEELATLGAVGDSLEEARS